MNNALLRLYVLSHDLWQFVNSLLLVKHIFYFCLWQLLPLKNGSESYTNWKNPPVTVYMQFYMFDVKNAYEIINNGEKPMVEQRGPYTYRWVYEIMILLSTSFDMLYSVIILQQLNNCIRARNLSFFPGSPFAFLTLPNAEATFVKSTRTQQLLKTI